MNHEQLFYDAANKKNAPVSAKDTRVCVYVCNAECAASLPEIHKMVHGLGGGGGGASGGGGGHSHTEVPGQRCNATEKGFKKRSKGCERAASVGFFTTTLYWKMAQTLGVLANMPLCSDESAMMKRSMCQSVAPPPPPLAPAPPPLPGSNTHARASEGAMG
jgi:hypothetical protein